MEEYQGKCTVAHYRRQLPAFQKVKDILSRRVLGEVRFAEIKVLQCSKPEVVAKSEVNWRINPQISGGGYFYDLAPHQIDLMLTYFGRVVKSVGIGKNQQNVYQANDLVTGLIEFENEVLLKGTWAFNVHPDDQEDICKIYGSKGHVEFSFFGKEITLQVNGRKEIFQFELPTHIQMPMIKNTIAYFLGESENPCSVEDAIRGLSIMEELSK